MPRRILLLNTDLEIGGTPTVVRELALRLNQPGVVDVEVACLSRIGPSASPLQRAGIPVHALNAIGALDLPRVVRDLVELSRRFDTIFSFLIHANTVAALASLFLRDVRFIQSIQTTQPKPRWHWWLQRLVQHAADTIVVPSPSTADAAVRWSGIDRDKVVVIPNAVEFDRDAIVPPVRRESRTGEALVCRVGFLGRLDPVKCVPDLVTAVAQLPEHFELHIFGDGPARGAIESTIRSLGVAQRVTLHGQVERPVHAMSQIDLLVLPSIAEGFGLVLIEAMSAGVPVVATDVPGIRDVVQDEFNGLLVPLHDPRSLAGAIERIGTDGSLRDRLITNGLECVRSRYTWGAILPGYRMLLGIT